MARDSQTRSAQPAKPDAGFSLDELQSGMRELLARGDNPYTALPDATADPLLTAAESERPAALTPREILVAILFVGTPDHRPIAAAEITALMNGVSTAEIDEWIADWNLLYTTRRSPYRIVSVGGGYRMELLPAYNALRERLHGGTKQARLSPAAVDVLSIVAYRQPVTAQQLEELRGAPSGAILNQLVRRELLRLERPADQPRVPRYHTTERFLSLFGLRSLADLPQGLE